MDMEAHLARLGIIPLKSEYFLTMQEHELTEIERRIKARLPETYRWFLLNYGATTFDPFISFRPLCPLPSHLSSTGNGPFTYFYGPMHAAYGRTYSLAAKIDTFADRMPDNLISIGSDIFGNQICLGIRGAEAGKIYYWDHEREENEDDYLAAGLPVPANVRFRNVHLIADSFEDFIHRLYVDEEA